jgi:hypothetical protein
MTPKEKAIELVINMQIEHDTEKRCYYFHMSLESAKRSSLIAVDEIIEALHEHHWQNRLIINYWEEVKQEIEKL